MREALLRAVAALREGRPSEAEPPLAEALETDLSDAARARILGLHAQALLGVGQAARARDQLREAMRLTRQLGDDAGLLALRALNGQIYARLAQDAEQDRLRAREAQAMARPLEALLAEADSPEARVSVFLRVANHLVDTGSDRDRARALAERGLSLAEQQPEAVKERVLARLGLARLEASAEARRALFDEALTIADAADEANLVTAVARAAEADGQPFTPRVFSDEPR
ncbi:MAG: hypothetical protein H6740_07825 [Alphaproteobacteria bacterium]|nr:hypothetical protein [Alphaproteobacteria bacterium]